jgi:hypothetical protein
MVVTTSARPTLEQEQRAQLVAQRLGAPYQPRDRTVQRMRRELGLELAYIVRRDREEVQDPDHQLFLHPGMFYLKRKDGLEHPLLRALSPDGSSPDVVVDATLGMGGDAIHVANLLAPRRLIGLEQSPALYSLLEAGLPRLAAQGRGWSRGAARIEARGGDARHLLAQMEPDSAEAVYLDPMFETPLQSSPGFTLLRRLAVADPLDEALLAVACRVARARVVLKLPGQALPPVSLPGQPWNRRVRGRAVDYAVIELAR